MIEKHNKRKGFTLLETIVAIFIVLISITGPMAIAQSGLRAAYLSRDQISAYYLAQDALEFVKNAKDQAGLEVINGNTGGWSDDFNNCFGPSVNCIIDTLEVDIANAISPASSPLDQNYLYFNASEGKYKTESGSGYEESIFSRFVNMEEVQRDETDSPIEYKVTVTISWETNPILGSREIEVVEYITDWAGGLVDS